MLYSEIKNNNNNIIYYSPAQHSCVAEPLPLERWTVDGGRCTVAVIDFNGLAFWQTKSVSFFVGHGVNPFR